jgi:hypothetical protein
MASNFVLSSKKSSTCPWARAGLGRLRVGRVKHRHASGFFSLAALFGKGRVLARLRRAGVMDSHFEHPECWCERNEEKRWV